MTACVDFETRPIVAGSGLAPVPVGVAVMREGTALYYAWGHPTGNNCTWGDARLALANVWDAPMVFHNAKFDIGVAVEHMGLPWPDQFDDTMIQTYLVDPLAKSLGLKKLAQRWLKMDPEERDAVFLWLKQNFKGPFLPDHKIITAANAGAYISYAPADLVGPYACGDVVRTRGLHDLLRPKIRAMGMDGAYAREIAIVRHGYEMERVGVLVDRERLERDFHHYTAIREAQEDTIRASLGDIELTPANLARALVEGGHADSLPKTPTGRLSTAKAAIEAHVSDATLARAIRYRGVISTLSNFYKAWLGYSERDGRVHPSWNQVKSEKGGARTGRFSCSEPNLTNVPTEFGEKETDPLFGLDIPFMRQYILPDDGCIIVPADFNGQEMRILAHYAEGKAAQIYRDDPQADFHKVASELILRHTGAAVARGMAKIVGFSLIYGSGVATLAQQLTAAGYPADEEQARKIKYAYFKAIPGLQQFINIFRDRDKVRTWGGRWLPTEPAHEVDGVWREFNYKLCNYLIQGSAADQSKEAIVRYGASREHGRLMMMVHDELVMSVPAEHSYTEVPILREAMEGMPGWDVPFRVEVEHGNNWHQLKEFA